MLRLHRSERTRFCDGLSRRDFLRIGGLGTAGLTLADLLRLRAEAADSAPSPKSVIMIYLPGGPSHLDMYDMKPDAPAEYRGEFHPIGTNVPGMRICELMPLQARIADKLAIVRGLKTQGAHDPYELVTGSPGRSRNTGQNPSNPSPAFGCVASRVRGYSRGMPPHVGIKNLRLLPSYDDPDTPAYLGSAHQAFRTDGPGLADLSLPQGVTLDRLNDRRALLSGLDRLQRTLDQDKSGVLAEMDTYTRQALEIISSNKVRDAFDISREPERTRAAYGEATDLLLARRLVEAGVSVVTLPLRIPVQFGKGVGEQANHWDTHAHNFKFLSLMLPRYDRAVYALITDLCQRGLDKDVAVVIWGEFGRTPKIGDSTPDGRGHWPEAGFVLLSGGGLKTGQVIGETDRLGERATGKPFTPSNVLATLYHVLGIDPATTFEDHAGRPRFVLEEGEKIAALI